MHWQLLPNNPEIGRAPYFWLGYLALFIVPFFFGTFHWREIVVSIAAVLVFLPLYFRAWWVDGKQLWCYALAITAIGVSTSPINYGASVFFIYSAAFAGGLGVRQGLMLIASNALIATATSIAFKLGLSSWPSVFLPVVIGLPTIYFAEIARTRQCLVRSQQEVEHLTKIAERERIARDMHDILGHTLSVIALKSELARKLIGRDANAAAEEIRIVEKTARDALRQVREVITGYRSAGLVFELDSARKVLNDAGVSLLSEGELFQFPPAIENVLSLAIREAVTNIIRHAKAHHCHIRFVADANTLNCEISDDGIGYHSLSMGNGLRGMSERLRALEGNLHLQDNAPGLKLILSIPLDLTLSGPTAS